MLELKIRNFICEECGYIANCHLSLIAHSKWHNSEKTRKLLSELAKDTNIKNFGNWIEEVVNCFKCGKPIKIKYRNSNEGKYLTKKSCKKDKYFCSRSCANSRERSEEVRAKISASVSKSLKEKFRDDKVYRENLLNRVNKNGYNLFHSSGEEEIIKFLKKELPKADWLINGNLHFKDENICRDVWSCVLKICIEYDGIWHFKDIHGQLEYKKMKDKLLLDWCIVNGYRLIRISDDLYKKYPDIVKEKLLQAINISLEQYIEIYI
jgi:hypothetical protein